MEPTLPSVGRLTTSLTAARATTRCGHVRQRHTITGGNGADFIDGDNPEPIPPGGPPFPPGTNNDNCNGGNGPDEISNCEITVE